MSRDSETGDTSTPKAKEGVAYKASGVRSMEWMRGFAAGVEHQRLGHDGIDPTMYTCICPAVDFHVHECPVHGNPTGD